MVRIIPPNGTEGTTGTMGTIAIRETLRGTATLATAGGEAMVCTYFLAALRREDTRAPLDMR